MEGSEDGCHACVGNSDGNYQGIYVGVNKYHASGSNSDRVTELGQKAIGQYLVQTYSFII